MLRTGAQSLDNIPQVKPIPPNAAALFKVLERPIGTYTGTVPVHFPLYEVTSGPLKASVSLNYNSTGGIRVEEIAGSMGLGFSLNNGAGQITQIIKGKRDDSDVGMLWNPYKKPSAFSPNPENMYNSWIGILDLDPDIFMYNFNGHSGRFFFKDDGTIVPMDNEGSKIECIYNESPGPNYKNILCWTITDENGNKYYFNQNQPVYSIVGGGISIVSSISWYLTEVRDRNEENSVTYTYRLSQGGSYGTYTYFRQLNVTRSNETDMLAEPSAASPMSTESQEYIVERIEGNSGSIVFSSSAGRTDLGGRKIDMISQYDREGNRKGFYKFNYGYFNANESDINIRRLKLKNFSKFNETGADSLCYDLDYEETVSLPSVYTTSLDYWGFYNGKHNQSMFPNTVAKTVYGNVIRLSNLGDRNADPYYGKANILKRITYPTGGYREFEYEGNIVLMNFNPNFIYHPDPYFTYQQSFTETIFSNDPSPAPCLKHTFTVNSTDGSTVFTYIFESGYYHDCSVRLFKTATLDDLYGGTECFSLENQNQGTCDLANGYYRLEVYKPWDVVLDNITGMWNECALSTDGVTTPNGVYNRNNRRAGGVRVKEIRDYDPVSNKINKTDYFYKLYSTDSTFTSGLLVSPVLFVSEVPLLGSYLSSSSNSPLASEGGSYVVYPEVRTIENGNGWTDRTYSYLPDVGSISYLMVPSSDYSNLRGKLLSERTYGQNGVLLKERTNSYESIEGNWQYGFRTKAYWWYIDQFGTPTLFDYPANPDLPYELPTGPTSFCYDYNFISRFCLLRQTTETTFSSSGNLGTSTDYVYDTYRRYPNNAKSLFYALRSESKNINNGIKATNYRYPFHAPGDFSLGLTSGEQTIKDVLKDQNYLQPLEITTTVTPQGGTSTLTEGVKLGFGYVNSNKLHLINVKEYKSPDISKYRETILSAYDAKGNLQEKYRTGGIKEVYLWGYGGNYPVAKVLGNNYSTVGNYITQSVLDNPTSDAALRTHLNALRTNLTGAQVSTYTYKPLIGMTSSTDAKGMTTYYIYDSFNRLKQILDNNNNILKDYAYHYYNQSASQTYYNTLQSQIFTKNNCGTGYTGSQVTYTIPANTYSSEISQADADQKAINEIALNGQNYANLNGECLFYNTAISQTFTKNDCPIGNSGTQVVYEIPAGKYSSTISQSDADQKAQNDMSTNGQVYADIHGTCTSPPSGTGTINWYYTPTFVNGADSYKIYLNGQLIVDLNTSNGDAMDSFTVNSGDLIRTEVTIAGVDFADIGATLYISSGGSLQYNSGYVNGKYEMNQFYWVPSYGTVDISGGSDFMGAN